MRLCIRWGPCSPSDKSPHKKFSAHVYCGQTTAWIKMVLGTEVGLSPGDFVLDGDPAPPLPKRGQSPYPVFSPFLLSPQSCMHQMVYWATVCKTVRPVLSDRCLSVLFVTLVYCGQTVGRIKIKLGKRIGLGPGHIVLDGDLAPHGWMD